MPPPKKAAKKAAKKSAKQADPKSNVQKDLLRAFEHLGRVESLQSSVEAGYQADVSTLVLLAQQELGAGDAKNAANLLRAAEHLSFATPAAGHVKQSKISNALYGALEEEYERLSHKAAEHWDSSDERHTAVTALYKTSLKGAKRAFDTGNYRQAMELVRAAEALTHVVKHGPEHLTAGRTSLSLEGRYR